MVSSIKSNQIWTYIQSGISYLSKPSFLIAFSIFWLMNLSLAPLVFAKVDKSQIFPQDLFASNDSLIFSLQERYPIIKNKLDTEELEKLAQKIELELNQAMLEDAEFLRVFYGQYKGKLREERKISMLLKLAFLYNRLFKTQEAIATLKELEKYDLKDSVYALYLYYYGLAEQDKSNFDSALANYMKALPIFEKENDQKNLAGLYSDLGRLYNSNKDYINSIKYYLKAVGTAESLKDTSLIAKTYSNIGTTYERMQEDELAIKFYTKGMELSITLQDSLKLAQNLLNIGNVYTKLKDYPKAHGYYLESLEICQQKDIPYGKMLNYLNIGLNAKDWGKYKLALEMTENGLIQVSQMDLPLEKLSLLQNKSDILAKLGNFETAYQLLLDAETLEREIFDKEKQARIEELTVKYETTIKAKDLENAMLEIESMQQRVKFLGVLIALLFVGTGLVIGFYRSRTLKMKALYLKNLEILKLYQQKKVADQKLVEEKPIPQKNKNQFEELFEQINQLLIQEETYKDPELNLNGLAQEVKSNSKYVSQAIQQETNKNFNAYINHLRVMEAQKILQNADKSINLNLNEVMYACGFKSRSTFYTAFQKETGMSPKQYRDLAISDVGKQIENFE